MIANRRFTHNGKTYEKGQTVDLPEGDIAVLDGMGFLEAKPDPKLKAPLSKDA